MKQYTEILTLKISKEERHYLDVLKNTYKIKTAKFIRDAITEKLRSDIKDIRDKYKSDREWKCPF